MKTKVYRITPELKEDLMSYEYFMKEIVQNWKFVFTVTIKDISTIYCYDYIPEYVIARVPKNTNYLEKLVSENQHMDLSEFTIGYSNDDFIYDLISIKLKVKLNTDKFLTL